MYLNHWNHITGTIGTTVSTNNTGNTGTNGPLEPMEESLELLYRKNAGRIVAEEIYSTNGAAVIGTNIGGQLAGGKADHTFCQN
jgi:hypothetical protein